LYRAMAMAFQLADPRIRTEDFLAAFRSRGCYLTDLSLEPVDRLATPVRRAMRSDGEKSLAQEIQRLRPGIVAPVLHSIVRNVENAAIQAGWHGEILKLPYPGRWSRHRDAFIEALMPVIRSLIVEPDPRAST
jgi:hypothetical protein